MRTSIRSPFGRSKLSLEGAAAQIPLRCRVGGGIRLGQRGSGGVGCLGRGEGRGRARLRSPNLALAPLDRNRLVE